MYYIKGDGYNGLMELQTKPAGGIFRGLLPLAVKKKANKAPNERAEIVPPPPIQPLQKVAEVLDRRSPPALGCSLITGAFPR